jgi:hypothetical protein
VYGDLLSSVRGPVFFGVPHRGTDPAYRANFAANVIQITQLRFGLGTNTNFIALKKNSRTFADISQQFIERTAALKIRRMHHDSPRIGVTLDRSRRASV